MNAKSLCLCSGCSVGTVGCVIVGPCFSKAHLPSTSHPQNRDEQLVHFLSVTRAGRGSAYRTTDSRRERRGTAHDFKYQLASKSCQMAPNTVVVVSKPQKDLKYESYNF